MSEKPEIISIAGLKGDEFLITNNGPFIKLTPEVKQNKNDARLFHALKQIVISQLTIPHNLVGSPHDDFDVSYQERLQAANAIAAEFKKLTGIDLNY